MRKFTRWYDALPKIQQMFFYVLVLAPLIIPVSVAMTWPTPMKVLLGVENLFAGFLLCYELYTGLWKRKKAK